jgi:subtilisin family serine protease
MIADSRSQRKVPTMTHATLRAALLTALCASGIANAADAKSVYLVSLAEPAATVFERLDQLGNAKRAANLEPIAISVTGQRKFDAKAAPVKRYVEFLHDRQDQVLAAAGKSVGRNLQPKARYDLVGNGFAIALTASEAVAFKKVDGVVSVEPDFKRELHTDAGPQWIGAEPVWNGTVLGANIRTRGEGIVVGVIDSGINASHPSFQDVASDGFDHVNPRGQRYGVCAGGGDARCNDKLIGIYDFINIGCTFLQTTPAGTDCNGHGSHVSGITLGNPVAIPVVAPTITLPRSFSGVAPRANLIMYKACLESLSCDGSALLSALNQAVADGVDVINYSIGGDARDPWTAFRLSGLDDAVAFYNARAAGIVPVTSAGNSGPGEKTVSSPGNAPWVITAAAITTGRRFSTTLANISGHGITTPFNIEGDGISSGTAVAQIVHAKDFGNALCGTGTATNNTTTCTSSASNPFPPGSLAGKIVICDRGLYARVEKGCNVKLAGAVGMILVNMPGEVSNIVADPHFLPATHFDAAQGTTIKNLVETARLASGQVTASISSVILRTDGQGDLLGDFSSRGVTTPYSGVLKPTIAAPGLEIFSADHRSNGMVSNSRELRWLRRISPALRRCCLAGNPTWTAAQVESALVTTASNSLMLEDRTRRANYVEGGAGRTRVDEAARAGLHFNVSQDEFRAADPTSRWQPEGAEPAVRAHRRLLRELQFHAHGDGQCRGNLACRGHGTGWGNDHRDARPSSRSQRAACSRWRSMSMSTARSLWATGWMRRSSWFRPARTLRPRCCQWPCSPTRVRCRKKS